MGDRVIRFSWYFLRFSAVCVLVYLGSIMAAQAQQSAVLRLQQDSTVQQHEIATNFGHLEALSARVDAFEKMQIERRITALETNAETTVRLLNGIAIGIAVQIAAVFLKKIIPVAARSGKEE